MAAWLPGALPVPGDEHDWRDRLCTEVETHRVVDACGGVCLRCMEYLEIRRDEQERCAQAGTSLLACEPAPPTV